MSKRIVKLFYGSTCAPCHQMMDMINMIKSNYEDTQFIYLDVFSDDNDINEQVERYKVTTVPTLIIESDDCHILAKRVGGITADELRKLLVL